MGRGSAAKSSPLQGRAPPWGYNTQLARPDSLAISKARPDPAANTAQLCPPRGRRVGLSFLQHSPSGRRGIAEIPTGVQRLTSSLEDHSHQGQLGAELRPGPGPLPEKELHLHTGCLAASAH